METDEQIKSAYRVYVDENGFLHVTFLREMPVPEDNVHLAQAVEQSVLDILYADPQKKYNILVDLLPLGKSGKITSKSRKVYARILAHPQAERFAFLGENIFLKVIVNFLTSAAGVDKKMAWFSAEAEGVSWLKNSQADN